MSPVDLGFKPVTFELLCVCVVSGLSACVSAVVYWPVSEPESSPFFSDISDMLPRLEAFNDPIYLVGDVNIRLDSSANSATIKFTELLASCGLESRISKETHDRHSYRPSVVTGVHHPSYLLFLLFIVNVGLSDHRMLQWSASPVSGMYDNQPTMAEIRHHCVQRCLFIIVTQVGLKHGRLSVNTIYMEGGINIYYQLLISIPLRETHIS